MLCSLLAWSLNQCLCVVRELSCWCDSGKGVLLVADTAAETPAVDLGYADVLSLRRRLERDDSARVKLERPHVVAVSQIVRDLQGVR